MAKLQRSWMSAILAAVVVGAIHVAAPEPALGTAVCPPAPNTLAGLCRTSFVLTAVDPLTTPPTDTESFQRPAGVPGWARLVVAVAAGISFGLALRQRRPAHSRADRRL